MTENEKEFFKILCEIVKKYSKSRELSDNCSLDNIE